MEKIISRIIDLAANFAIAVWGPMMLKAATAQSGDHWITLKMDSVPDSESPGAVTSAVRVWGLLMHKAATALTGGSD